MLAIYNHEMESLDQTWYSGYIVIKINPKSLQMQWHERRKKTTTKDTCHDSFM